LFAIVLQWKKTGNKNNAALGQIFKNLYRDLPSKVSRGLAATYQPARLGIYTATALRNYRYFYTKDEGINILKIRLDLISQ